MIDALIQPVMCADQTKCFTDDEKAIIYLKSNRISLFTTWKLTIKNIIFDASELIPEGTCHSDNKYAKTRCCDSSGEFPTVVDPNGNY